MTRRPLAIAARVLVASGVGSATDVMVLLLLASMLPVGAAAVLASLAGGAVNFALSRRYVFPPSQVAWWRQWPRYLLLVVACSALANGALVHAGVMWLGLPVLVAKGIAALLVLAGWNYPVSARWVFGGPSWKGPILRPPSRSSAGSVRCTASVPPPGGAFANAGAGRPA